MGFRRMLPFLIGVIVIGSFACSGGAVTSERAPASDSAVGVAGRATAVPSASEKTVAPAGAVKPTVVWADVAKTKASAASQTTAASAASAVTPAPAVALVISPPPGDNVEANFRFLVSDEENAINDFLSLVVVITSIGIQQGGESGRWLELTPQVPEVDLTQLQGANAQEIWSGKLDPGSYSKVFIFVDRVTGVLEATGEEVDLKLPSGKLQISVPFEVTENSLTSFVYDLSVVAAGGGGGKAVKYILKPQIGQSGPDKSPSVIKGRPGDSELTLKLEGEARPGREVTLLVRHKGEALEGAVVTVNDGDAVTTGADGRVTLAMPQDVSQVKIKVRSVEREGELEIEFPEVGKAATAKAEKGPSGAAGKDDRGQAQASGRDSEQAKGPGQGVKQADKLAPSPAPAAAADFDGTYVLFVHQAGGSNLAGKTVTFTIGKFDTAESATWEQGGVDELNLTASSADPGYTGMLPGGPNRASVGVSLEGGLLASPGQQPIPPHVFLGTAIIDGVPAPEGTIVTARIDGVQVPGAEAAVEARATAVSAAAMHPVGKALEPLGGSLVRVWKFDPATQEWTFYDPRPAFADFNSLRQVAAGEFYWVVLSNAQTATLNGQQRSLFAGWNPLTW